jgi:alkaline phosphatase D
MRRLFAIAALLLLPSALFSQMQDPTMQEYTRGHLAAASADLPFDVRLKPFYHGVASGDPLTDRVILWTRVTPDNEGPIEVAWRIATDTALANVVNSGIVTTDQSKDYTVKVDATGLQPGTTYYYGFTTLGLHSLTGRTKTAPATGFERLRFAVASCANFQAGYFNAYAAMAERNDVDAVIFLGDYIYEYQEGGFGYREEIGRGHEPKNEIVSLSDYRIRYSFYRLEPELRRLHQQLPFIAVWDDHESANNSWRDGADNHQPQTEGAWADRKKSSVAAYLEWMPVREVPQSQPEQIYRVIRYGDLADILMLETRLTARDQPLPSLNDPAMADTTRTMLGATQYEWLQQHLQSSTARWKLIGNQTVLMPVVGLGLADSWDGYPVERRRLLAEIDKKGLGNVVVLTGDIHSTAAADLAVDPFDTLNYNPTTGVGSVAVEFVTPSITSPNLNEIQSQPPRNSGSLLIESALRGNNPHLKLVELDSHGYIVLDVDSSRVQADWFYADTILTRRGAEHFFNARLVRTGVSHLETAAAPSAPKADAPAPAPLEPPAGSSSVSIPQTSLPVVIGNYPNPVAGVTLINYLLATPDHITLTVHDASGKGVALLLHNQQHQAGIYTVRFDASALPAGSYYYTIRTGNGTVTRGMVVRR